MKTNLPIPSESLAAAEAVIGNSPFADNFARAIGTPFVVAELRRLLHDDTHPGTLAEALRDRIGELEAEDPR